MSDSLPTSVKMAKTGKSTKYRQLTFKEATSTATEHRRCSGTDDSWLRTHPKENRTIPANEDVIDLTCEGNVNQGKVQTVSDVEDQLPLRLADPDVIPEASMTSAETDSEVEKLPPRPTDPDVNSEAPSEAEKLPPRPTDPDVNSEAPSEVEKLPPRPTDPDVNSEAPSEVEKLPPRPTDPDVNSEAPSEVEKLPPRPTDPDVNSEAPSEAEKLPPRPTDPDVNFEAPSEAEKLPPRPVDPHVSSEAPMTNAKTVFEVDKLPSSVTDRGVSPGMHAESMSEVEGKLPVKLTDRDVTHDVPSKCEDTPTCSRTTETAKLVSTVTTPESTATGTVGSSNTSSQADRSSVSSVAMNTPEKEHLKEQGARSDTSVGGDSKTSEPCEGEETRGVAIKRKRKHTRRGPSIAAKRPKKTGSDSAKGIADSVDCVKDADPSESVKESTDSIGSDETDESGQSEYDVVMVSTAQQKEARRLARLKQLQDMRTREMREARMERARKRGGEASPLKRPPVASQKKVSWEEETSLVSVFNYSPLQKGGSPVEV